MKVLVLCTGNSCRSQMAQGFLKSFHPGWEVLSAGTKPAERVNPYAIKVMAEVGIDIEGEHPKLVDQFIRDEFDYVITVCDGAREVCPVFTGKVKQRVHIGFDDPADATGTDEEIIPVYRRVRDEIAERFRNFPAPLTEPTRHQFVGDNTRRILLLLAGLLAWYLAYTNLKPAADWLVDQVFGLESGKHLTEALRFFIFEVPKVLLLLVLIIFFVGILRSFFTPERTRKALEGKSLFAGNVLAALLGIVTPFCSCSAIPLFLGFMEAGVPLGVTFSFLIAAPMINEVAVVLLFGMFGWKVAVTYVLTGLILAILAGWIIGRLKLEKWVESWVYAVKSGQADSLEEKPGLWQRVRFGLGAVKEIVGKVWVYIVIGIGVGAAVHGFVPEKFMAELMGDSTWYSVPLSILIGVPLYSNAAGIIPIVSVLIEKGVPLGTALAFMMSVIGLSLPEMIILRKVLKLKLIFVFVGVVSFGIIIVGYLFNFIY